MEKNLEQVARFLSELESLKNLPRAGWLRIGVPPAEVESVAEHSFGSAVIAYVIALLEGVPPEKSTLITLFHDIGEARTGDITPLTAQILGQLGVTKKEIDKKAEEQQIMGLPWRLRENLNILLAEYKQQESLNAKIARDAMLIDRGLIALALKERGFPVQLFIDEIGQKLQRPSSQRLWNTILKNYETLTMGVEKRSSGD